MEEAMNRLYIDRKCSEGCPLIPSDSSGYLIVATVDPLVLFSTSLVENQAGQLPSNNTPSSFVCLILRNQAHFSSMASQAEDSLWSGIPNPRPAPSGANYPLFHGLTGRGLPLVRDPYPSSLWSQLPTPA